MDDFSYMVGEKDELVVVLFYGKIAQKEIAQLEEVFNQIKEKKQPIIIFNFRDVVTVMPATHITFARIQAHLRKQNKILGLCSLKPEIKSMLKMAGIVRDAEIFNNVPDAWKVLKAKLATRVPEKIELKKAA